MGPGSALPLRPRPGEWSYQKWFRQIVAAVASEYRIQLVLRPDTIWVNVGDGMRSEMTASLIGHRGQARL